MHLLISNHTLLSEIQQAFNNMYPYLRLQFCPQSNSYFSSHNKPAFPDCTVEKIFPLANAVVIDVSPQRTIAQVAKDFKDCCGIQLSVYRKSGSVWNEISLTDNWTLNSQNTAGKFISTEMEKESVGSTSANVA